MIPDKILQKIKYSKYHAARLMRAMKRLLHLLLVLVPQSKRFQMKQKASHLQHRVHRILHRRIRRISCTVHKVSQRFPMRTTFHPLHQSGKISHLLVLLYPMVTSHLYQLFTTKPGR
jgi:hypothetical protein